MRKLYRFLRYGPTALKVLGGRLDTLAVETVNTRSLVSAQGEETKALRQQMAALRESIVGELRREDADIRKQMADRYAEAEKKWADQIAALEAKITALRTQGYIMQPERPEDITEAMRRKVPGLTVDLAKQIDWSRM